MEQTNHNYPKFEEGQVLTSKALNDYFGYLDEQQRLTRAKFLGVGIINGLECTFDGTHVIIKKGTAVTPDGYFINLSEDKTYALAYEYDKKSNMIAKQNPLTGTVDKDFEKFLDCIDYVLYEDEEDAINHNQHPDLNNCISMSQKPEHSIKHIIGLLVDFISLDSITKCSELSCDIVQTNYQIEFRPVLIDRELIIGKTGDIRSFASFSLESESYYSFQLKVLNLRQVLASYEISNPRIGTYIQSRSIGFNSYNSYIRETIKTIAEDYLIGNTEKLFSTIIIHPLFKSWNITIAQKEELKNHINVLKNKDGNIPSYYLQHLIYLEKAIEEFADLYHEFAAKYKTIPTEKNYFQRIVTIGEEHAMEGEYWISSQFCYQQLNSILHEPQFLADYSLLKKALDRVLSIARNFSESYQTQTTSCDYLRPHAKLEEHPKPKYLSSTIIWNLHSIYPRLFNTFEPFDSIIIDGREPNTLSKIINDFKKKYQIPFTIDFVPVNPVTYTQEKYNPKMTYPSSPGLKPFETPAIDFHIDVVRCFFNNHPEIQANDYDDILDKIEANQEIDAVSARKFINTLRQKMPIIDMDSYLLSLNNDTGITYDVRANLSFCLDYVRHYLECIPIQIGGCPYNGRLTVFYDNNNNTGENEQILLIVGSNAD